jgi:hypothetical protein
MEHRIGKYGGFWYCRQHGTISDKDVASILTAIPQTTSHAPPIDLMFEIERETMDLGFQTSEIERWIVDDEAAADYEEDHWMNLRPY